MSDVPHFIGKPAPKGYIAGLSRGAKAFTTEASVGKLNEMDDYVDKDALNAFDMVEKRRKRKKTTHQPQASHNNRHLLAQMTQKDWLDIPQVKNLSNRQKTTHFSNAVPVSQAEKTYVTHLEQLPKSVGDTDKHKQLLETALKADPYHIPSWIALIRLEENRHQVNKAIQLCKEALTTCPDAPEIWLDYIRLSKTPQSLLQQAVDACPTDVRLWEQAITLSKDSTTQLAFLDTALDHFPTHPPFLSHPVVSKDRRISLLVQHRHQLTFDLLCQVIFDLPFEEAASLLSTIQDDSPKYTALACHFGLSPRITDPIKVAEEAIDMQLTSTVASLIPQIPLDCLSSLSKDLQWQVLWHHVPTQPSLMEALYDLRPTLETLEQLMAVHECPHLWLKHANSVQDTLGVLLEAYKHYKQVDIQLALVQCYMAKRDYKEALLYTDLSNEKLAIQRVRLQHILQLDSDLSQATKTFSKCSKLWLLAFQLHQDTNALQQAIQLDPQDSTAYVQLAMYYKKQGKMPKARAILAQGRKQTQSSVCWSAWARLEASKSIERALEILAMAPKSDLVVHDQILYQRDYHALKTVDMDAVLVLYAKGLVCWHHNCIEEATALFQQCTTKDPLYGDAYIALKALGEEVNEPNRAAYGQVWTHCVEALPPLDPMVEGVAMIEKKCDVVLQEWQ